MGGKQKQSQRTKGNVQPSSSARAAELLTTSGGQAAGFVGFGALSGDLGYVPTTQGQEEADSNVDADFRMTLRKLSKKDATTKLKALQEFSALCKEKDVDSVKTVLPFWPRIYSKLAIDHDRRVREAVQQAFEQLVLRARRSLAPHLKALMGSWLVGQCDTHAPAASASRAAFQAAFPPAKQTEALVFCREEILSHLQDNLFVQTPQTLSDAKSTEPEDMETKYQRVLTGSLLALRELLVLLPVDQQPALEASYAAILANSKLWKMAKHSQVMVRSSLYSLLAAVCQVQPELARQCQEKLCPTVLYALDETDPVVVPALWQAALYVVSVLDDCWKYVNPRKGVLPKLWTILRQGGAGNAAAIHPNLLPLLSKMPQEVLGEGNGFYKEFFSNIKLGLREERVVTSPSECAAVVRALMECLRYCLLRHLDCVDLTQFLIHDQLLTVIEASIVERSPALHNSPLHPLFVDLVLYLHKTASSSSDDREAITPVLNTIWTSLQEISTQQVNAATDDSSFRLVRLASLLAAFKEPPARNPHGKTAKVRFQDPEEPASATCVKTKSKPKIDKHCGVEDAQWKDVVYDTSALLEADGPVYGLVCKAARLTQREIDAGHSLIHLQFLSKLTSTYNSPTLLRALLGLSVTDGSSWLPVDFLTATLAPLSRVYDQPEAVDSLVAMYLAAFAAAMSKDPCNNSNPNTQPRDHSVFLTQVLKSCDRLPVLERVLQTIHREHASDSAVTARWFKGPECGEKILDVAKALCDYSLGHQEEPQSDLSAQDLTAHWALVSMGLSTNEHFEPIIALVYVEEILGLLQRALPSAASINQRSEEDVYRCVSFVCDVAQNFFSNVKGCLMLQPAEELLVSLFQLACQDAGRLSDAVLVKVTCSWRLGVLCLLRQKGGLFSDDGFFSQAASHIRYRVLNDGDNMDRLGRLCDMTVQLGQCMEEGLPVDAEASQRDEHEDEEEKEDARPMNATVMQLYKQLLMPFVHSSISQWTEGPIICGSLTFKEMVGGDLELTSISTVPKCLAPVVFTSSLLVAMPMCALATVATARDHSNAEDNVETPVDLLLDIPYSIAYCRAVLSSRRQMLVSSELGRALKQLEMNFARVKTSLDKSSYDALVQKAVTRSLTNGGLWALCLGVLLESGGSDVDLEQLLPIERFCQLEEGSLHTLQVSLPHWKASAVSQLGEILAAQIITTPQETLLQLPGGGRGFLAVLSHVLMQEECLLPQPDASIAVSSPSSRLLDPDVVLSILSEMQAWRDQSDHLFLFDSEIKTQDWPTVSFNAEMARFLAQVVHKLPARLTDKHWDFFLCSLLAWLQSINVNPDLLLNDTATQCLATMTFDLLTSVAKCIKSLVQGQHELFPANLLTEWTEFFSEGAYNLVLPLFVNSSAQVSKAPSAGEDLVMRSLGAAVAQCPLAHLRQHQLPAKLTANENTNLPDELQTLLNHLCPLLMSHDRSVQVAAYRLLLSIMPELSKHDEGQSREEQDKDELSRSPPLALMCVLETGSQAVEVIVSGLDFGDRLELEPHTDEHTYTTAYLLSWRLLLTFFCAAASELRVEYAQYIRDSSLVETLMGHLFSLMPETPLIPLSDGLVAQPPHQKLAATRNMFGEQPLLEIAGDSSPSELQHLACAVYRQALQDLPAILRQWINSKDKKTAGIMDGYTSKYVSPILCAEELAAIQQGKVPLRNMTVRTRPAAREVVSTYNVEEVSMELVVTLATNHPLGPITVDGGRRVGVANTQWRNWLLQLTTYLSHQNGSILDGLTLWKRNVDKRFEGVDECMVCFSVIHGTNYQLPKLQCKTCKKKFHSACLYKWFSTSNNSTCPLCRNLF